VGYDKYPHGPDIQGPYRTEPVFRYSVRLPQSEWFRQKEEDGVYWLSIVAVYDENQPDYDWGWTNHEHVYNDDAVAGYPNYDGTWNWYELYDQTGTSEDMSFMLFTEPGCFPSSYSTYFDWLALGKPNCWCGVYGNPMWPYQCDGDADNLTEGLLKYRIYNNDYDVLVANWKKKITDPTLNACADFDHKSEGLLQYRVYNLDYNVLVANWKKKDSNLPGNCVRPE
jgi:hypothetical protein